MATSPPLQSEPGPIGYAPAGSRPRATEGVPLLIARLIVGLAFIVMGWMKVSNPVLFLKQIHLYNMIPDGLSLLLNTLTVVLPWIEIACGALLLLGIGVRGASLLLLIMLAVFTAAIFMRAMGIHHAQGTPFCSIKFDCGCGSGEQYICRKLPENLGLILLSLFALFSKTDRFCLWRNLVPAGKSPWRIEGY